jgi:hypothetical protein
MRLAHVGALSSGDLDRLQPSFLVELRQHLWLERLDGGGRRRERDAHEGAGDNHLLDSHSMSSHSSAMPSGVFGSDGTRLQPERSGATDVPCPKCQRIFDGRSWNGWEHDSANWTIVDGAMRGFGQGARAAFTKAE